MPNKCCVCYSQSNYDDGPKETVFSSPTRKRIVVLDIFGLELWIEKAGNRLKNHAYVESILNIIIIKQRLKENDVD